MAVLFFGYPHRIIRQEAFAKKVATLSRFKSYLRGPRARASRITLPNQTPASRTWIIHGAISVSLTHFIGSLPVARG